MAVVRTAPLVGKPVNFTRRDDVSHHHHELTGRRTATDRRRERPAGHPVGRRGCPTDRRRSTATNWSKEPRPCSNRRWCNSRSTSRAPGASSIYRSTPRALPFQQSAWMVLRTIPYGQTISYGQQAEQLGDPNKARAVGAANGKNPLSIVVPCHRVVGSTRSPDRFRRWTRREVVAAGPRTATALDQLAPNRRRCYPL